MKSTYPHRRHVLPVCLLAALALSVSACGSSSKSSSATTSSATTSSAPTSSAPSSPSSTSAATTSTNAAATAPTGASFKLGVICSCSGVQAADLAPTGKIAQAWASSVNAQGGINGHPVTVVVKDDGAVPATSLQDVKGFVEQDHVKAIIDVSAADASWASYVAKSGVPVVGGIGPEPTFLSNPDFYPAGGTLLPVTLGTVDLAKKAGLKHFGVVYCAESPVCAQVVPLASLAAKLDGLTITSAKISGTAPNYTAPCLQLKSAGVDSLFVADNAPIVSRFIAACAQQGYKPRQMSQFAAGDTSWLKDPNFQKILLTGYNANTFDPSLPAVAQFQAALNKYIPGLLTNGQLSPDAIFPWAGGKLFEAAAKAGHLTPSSTPADVKRGLYALKNETLGGLAPPLTSHRASQPSWRVTSRARLTTVSTSR